ncbi:MAG: peptidoglycan DD-metalloendopeptidase family protein [Oscillospiraceae bacterium]
MTRSKEQQKALDEKIAATNDDISKEQENQQAIADQLVTVQDTLQELDKLLADIKDQITNQQAKIDATDLLITAKRAEINGGVEDFKVRLRAMYLAGNASYTELLLGSDDFYDLLMKMELVRRVTKHDSDQLNALIDLKKQYESTQTLQQDQQAELEAQKTEQVSQQDKWKEQVKKLNDLYAQSKEAQADLEAEQQGYYDDRDRIDAESDAFEKDLQDAIDAAEKARQEAENNSSGHSGGTVTGSGSFIWPVPGFYTVTSPFGPRWGTNHKGMDIAGAGVHYANFVAADAGVVIKTNDTCTHDYGKSDSCGCGGGYGNYVMIDHGNGYITVYGHAASINVSVGDKVTQGQVIGQVGSTGWSTGYHLHFEVRENGTPINPAQFFNW